MTTFDDYAPLYNLMYHEKAYPDEADFVINELCSSGTEISSILDLGCGTGTHAVHFARNGRHVFGVDVSKRMLELARRNLEGTPREVLDRVQFAHCDVRNFEVNNQFDAAVSLFHVMSYQVRDQDVAATVATARRHLAKGSPFLFDFWHGPAVIKSGLSMRRREVEDGRVRVSRIATPSFGKQKNTVDVAYHFVVLEKSTGIEREFDETHTMRYFFPHELERALLNGGFRVKKCAEWLTNNATTDDTFSAYILAVAQ